MKKPIPFGKYLLLERVNVGGMAEVFKAKAFGVEGFERLVAVKRILPSIAEDQEFITMFVDEAKISVQLTHANIAQIFDLGKAGDSFFIAMEYVHGKDMRAIFERARKRGETVPIPMACYVAMKVCEGLDYAHNKKDAAGRELNLVHRDVSPQNLLLSYDGEVKVIDFGIAKAAGKANKTQAGILKGKFGYMSPEQVRGMELDRKSDIFAVGIVLYELLTGERLFVGESDFSTLEKVKNVEIMPPSTYNRRIPDELEQIVLKALAREPEDRYQTAMDLHDDLQSFMYTSGNFFSRKDLSAYMRKAFAEEIAKETAREEEYRRMEAEVGRPSGVSSGLEAFDNIQPATALNPAAPRPGVTTPIQAQSASPGIPSPLPPRQTPPPPHGRNGQGPTPPNRKPTLMGQGALGPVTGAPTPPPPPPPKRSSLEPPPPKAQARAGGLDMAWDEEELSTQIYDRPESGLIPDLPDVSPRPPSSPGALPGLGSLAGSQPAPRPGALGSLSGLGPISSPGTLHGPSSPGSLPAPYGSPGYNSGPAPSGPMPMPGPYVPTGAPGHGAPSPFDVQVAPMPAPQPMVQPMMAPPPDAGLAPPPPSGGTYTGEVPAAGGREPTAVTRRASGAPQSSGRSPWLPIAVVLALGAAAAALYVVFAGSSPGTVHITTTPTDAVVYLDAQLVTGSTSSPFVIANVPRGPHMIEVRKNGYRAWGTSIDIQPGQELTLPPVTLEAEQRPGTGFMLATTPPGAAIFVDNVARPERTPATLSDLAPGPHQVRAELGAEYTPWVTQINVREGEVVQLPPATFVARAVNVQFTSEPTGAEVSIARGAERRLVGTTPTSAAIEMTGGSWTVVVAREGYREYSAPLTVREGDPNPTHHAQLERRSSGGGGGGSGSRPGSASTQPYAGRPQGGSTTSSGSGGSTGSGGGGGGTGTLLVNTSPWSEVIVDGRSLGNTPIRGVQLSAGSHSIVFVNREYNIREVRNVTIRAGQSERLIAQLTPGSGG